MINKHVPKLDALEKKGISHFTCVRVIVLVIQSWNKYMVYPTRWAPTSYK